MSKSVDLKSKTEKSSLKHLAGIIEAYLRGESWVSDERLKAEFSLYHTPQELHEVLQAAEFSYLQSINPGKLEQLKKHLLA